MSPCNKLSKKLSGFVIEVVFLSHVIGLMDLFCFETCVSFVISRNLGQGQGERVVPCSVCHLDLMLSYELIFITLNVWSPEKKSLCLWLHQLLSPWASFIGQEVYQQFQPYQLWDWNNYTSMLVPSASGVSGLNGKPRKTWNYMFPAPIPIPHQQHCPSWKN